MRTERRQELRTNELSQQIEGITEYMKRNTAAMTIIVVVAAVAVGGGFLYKNSQTTRRLEAWATISMPNNDATPASRVSRALAIADERLNPGLTTAALLDAGQVAMVQIAMPSPTTEGEEGGDAIDWAAKAKAAYLRIIDQPNADVTALGQAYIALGVLAENESQMTKAADWYRKIVDDKEFAATPFETQAKYRLENLDQWAKPVVFAPPPEPILPIPLADPTSAAPAAEAQPTSEIAVPASDGTYENKTLGQLKQRDQAPEPAKATETEDTPDQPVKPAETATGGQG